MIGEISLGGVYFPALLILGLVALVLTTLLVRLLSVIGAYRLVAVRPVVDLALFMLVLWGVCLVSAPWQPAP